jgi:hypothetical protein
MPSAASGTLARDELRFACGLERRKWEMAAGFLLAAFGASWLSAGFSAGADEGPGASTVFKASGTGEGTNGAVLVFAGGSTFMEVATFADCGKRLEAVTRTRLCHQYHPPPARAARSSSAAIKAIKGERRGVA